MTTTNQTTRGRDRHPNRPRAGHRWHGPAVAAALAITAAAGAARADVLTENYDVTKCLGETRDSNGFTRSGDTLTNNTGVTLTAHCPIVKKTSGPSATVDYFSYADIPVTTNGAAVECHVKTWRANITYPYLWSQGYTNLISDSTATTTTSKVLRINATFGSPYNYWAGFNGNSQWPSWYYLDLWCTLPPGTAIKNYKVNEQGSDTGYRIYPSVACKPHTSNQILWTYMTMDPGGIMKGQADGSPPPYVMECPVPTNTTIEYAVGRATGNNAFGCNLNSATAGTYTWSTTLGNEEWPSQILPRVGQPMIAIPSLVSSNLFCGQNSASGDGKLISYRSRPQPARTAWTATASVSNAGEGPARAIDNDPAKRWSTGVNGATNQWFRIDLGSTQSFNQITLETNSTDYARSFEIKTSLNGTSWTSVTTVTGGTPFTSVKFAQQVARYIEIRLTSGFNWWWSIHELNVYNAPN